MEYKYKLDTDGTIEYYEKNAEEFDAIWACASLLHVSRKNMQETMLRISQALKQGGICYCSWKYGDMEYS